MANPSSIPPKAFRMVTEGKVRWSSFLTCYINGDSGQYTVLANLNEDALGWSCNCEFGKHNSDPLNHCSHVYAAYLTSSLRESWRKEYLDKLELEAKTIIQDVEQQIFRRKTTQTVLEQHETVTLDGTKTTIRLIVETIIEKI